MAKLMCQSRSGNLGERAGQLDTGRSASDHDKGHPGSPSGLVGLALSDFERREDPPTNLHGVAQALEARGKLGPVVVAEVSVGGAGRQDQKVVGHFAIGKDHSLSRDIDLRHFNLDHFGIVLVPKDQPDRRGDVGKGQRSRGNLIEQRLEQVVIDTVDHGYPHGSFAEAFRRPETRESGPDDHNMGRSVRPIRFSHRSITPDSESGTRRGGRSDYLKASPAQRSAVRYSRSSDSIRRLRFCRRSPCRSFFPKRRTRYCESTSPF